MLADSRLRMLTFTGSAEVGWKLKAMAPRLRCTLELGGNAAMIVHEDADVELAARSILTGGFSYSGQSCISVQRVFVHKTRWQTLAQRLTEGIEQMVAGDPLDEMTQIGPMISLAAAERAATGSKKQSMPRASHHRRRAPRRAALAALLAKVRAPPRSLRGSLRAHRLPQSYDTFDEAIAAVNDSRYGLQAAVFTKDWGRITQAFRRSKREPCSSTKPHPGALNTCLRRHQGERHRPRRPPLRDRIDDGRTHAHCAILIFSHTGSSQVNRRTTTGSCAFDFCVSGESSFPSDHDGDAPCMLERPTRRAVR